MKLFFLYFYWLQLLSSLGLKRKRPERKTLTDYLQQGNRNDLKKIQSSFHGTGVACTSDLNLGDFVCTYPGELLSEKEGLERMNNYTKTQCGFMFEIRWQDKTWYIDGSLKTGMGNYLNHSLLEPNVKPKLTSVDNQPILYFTAARFVKAGTEFRYCYGNQKTELKWYHTS